MGECLDSILAQTFQDFEVVLVNDCSTDNSRAIVESYLEKFGGRLRIYDNEKNSGAGATRNNGLLKAVGEYIYFMDADDLILADGLEQMYKIAKYFDVDVVNLTKSYNMSNDGQKKTLVHLALTRSKNEPILESNLEWRVKGILENYLTAWAPWRRLVRREFLIKNEIFFPEKIMTCEDEIWTHGLLFCAKKIVHVPLVVYLYRLSENSLTKAKRTNLQNINMRINTIIHGLKWIDNIMNKIPFFGENPSYRYAVLEHAAQRYFTKLYKSSLKVLSADMYMSIKSTFGKNLGDNEILVSVLCTMISSYRKIIEKNKERIAELETQLKIK